MFSLLARTGKIGYLKHTAIWQGYGNRIIGKRVYLVFECIFPYFFFSAPDNSFIATELRTWRLLINRISDVIIWATWFFSGLAARPEICSGNRSTLIKISAVADRTGGFIQMAIPEATVITINTLRTNCFHLKTTNKS